MGVAITSPPATGGSGGIGDVNGPGSSTDNAVARFDGTTGKLIQNSTATIADNGAVSIGVSGTSSYTQLLKFVNDTATTPMINWVQDTGGNNAGLQFSSNGGIVASIGNTGGITGQSFSPGGGSAKFAVNFFTLQKTGSDASTPPVNYATLYIKTDENAYLIDSAGTVSRVNCKPKKETFVLGAGDITNQYIDLANVACVDTIHFLVAGYGSLLEGASYDYSVSYTGGAGSKTRITFLNDLATGGAAPLVATDVVQVCYAY